MGLLDDLGSALYGAAGSANRFMDDPIGQVKGLLQQRMQEWADSAAQNTQAAQMAMSKGPAMQDVGFQKMLDATVNHGGLLAPTVYTGTPHTWAPEPGFPNGRMRLDKIGTGEGAQVYGHGGYMAENRGVAETYRNALSKFEAKDQSGAPLAVMGKDGDIASGALEWLQTAKLMGEKDPYEYALRNTHGPMNDLLHQWRSSGVTAAPGGNLYQMYLPDEVLPKMLQWDKPLSEQPEAVQQAVQRAGDANFPGWQPPKTVDELIGKNRLDPKTEKWWAQELLKQGIPGLSYLDGGSRSAGSGTLNHVIWDQGLLNQMIPTPVK